MVIGTGRKAKGGINSVIDAYSHTDLWNNWNCYWLETHSDRNIFTKIFFFISAILKFIIKIPFYSIVHIHLSEPGSAFRKSIFVYIAKACNKNVIVHFHSFSINTTIEGDHQKLYYEIFRKADIVIALSIIWKNWISQKWPEFLNKVEVLYNPCPAVTTNIDQVRSKIVLFAGTLNARKGYSDLIRGFALIADRNKEWKLIFAGNGEIKEAQLLAEKLGIKGQVLFKGWVSGKEKDNLFRKASIFCLPSYAEGLPMAILDAIAYGLPLITTHVGGLSDILVNNKNALIIKPGDTDEISSAIEKLILSENSRKRLSLEALKLSQGIFSIKEITKQLDSIYNKLLRGN